MTGMSRSTFAGISLVVSILLVPGLVSTARAQAVAVAQVSGTVTDASGSAIPNAQVAITETDKHQLRSATADSTGRYSFPNLPVGPYKLEVKASGFKDYVQTGIILQVAANVEINVAMQVGALTERIEVTASAGLVETRDTSISQVIEQRSINELPLNGRQATALVLLSGASVTAPGGGMVGSKNYFSSTTISVGGGQANGTAYLLDGGDNTDTMTNVNLPFPFPDALQEFSVETSALSGRFGTHPGATVNVVTKSGANQYHGDLFEYLRNGNVNARPFFSTAHDSLKRNQFGGTAGGKIIPDKVFFFAGFQGTRNRSTPPTTTSFIPTAAALTGDFSALTSGACQSSGNPVTIKDTTTGQPFAGSQLPKDRLNASALKLANNYLPISAANSCGRVQYGIPTTGDEDQIISRIDWTHTTKHNLFGRYFLAQYSNPPVYDGKNLLTTTQPGNLERAQSVTISDNYSFGPSTLNAFHATFTRRRDNRGPATNQIGPNDIGINIFQKVPNFLLVTVSNAFSVGCGTCAPGHFNVNSYQLADDVDLIRGRHQIAFGFNFVRTQNNLISGFNENGTYTFNGSVTANPSSSTTTALADFLLGRPSDFQQTNPTPDDLRASIVGIYVQDTFRLSPRLTLNAGLRWEPTLPDTDKYGRGTSFNRTAFAAGQVSTVYPNAPAGMFFYGDKGIPKAMWNGNLNAFAPRIGFAWNPHGDGRDTFRMGAAILYDHAEIFFNERETTNPPYGGAVQVATPAGGFTNPYQGYPGGSPFPPGATVTFPLQGIYINMPVNVEPTYMAQWNASYQRQFAQKWLVQLTYIGNKTTHLWVGSEVNPAVYIPGNSTTSNTNQRRMLYLQNPTLGQYYASINSADLGSNSRYEAGLLSVQRRFSQHLTFLTNYTYSYCISDLDFTGELGGSPNSQPFNRSADRGPCNYDYRHIFNTSMVATSPAIGGSWMRRITGGWQLAPLIRATSGAALSVTSGADNSRTGLNNDRPLQIAANPYVSGGTPCPLATQLCVAWLRPSGQAFIQNPVGTFGNVGRDALRGPGALNFDLSLSRIFAITERYRLQARFEAFNAINHANFGNPATNLSSSTFGLITGTASGSVGEPRILQFALKLHF